jgi:diguanylate cyclase (GGDEF)-like protein/PAS domain S-box-containing protein
MSRQAPPMANSLGSLRRNALRLLVGVAAVAALMVAVLLVHSQDAHKDHLRQAQVALAEARQTQVTFAKLPEVLLSFSGRPPGATGRLAGPVGTANEPSRALAHALAELQRLWPTATARTLAGEARQLNAYTATLTNLLAQRQRGRAVELNSSRVRPATAKFERGLATASSQLAGDVRAAARTAWRATLAIVAIAGLLMALLLVGGAVARRRRQREEIERGVLAGSERRLQALVEHGSDMITVVALDATVLYQAGAVQAMLGYATHELEGAKLTDWVEPPDRPMLLALCETPRAASHELRLRHRDGSVRTCEVHATSLLHDPAWRGVVLNIWDQSERKALEERLRHQAFHDALTGLPNRVLARDRAEQMLARARRQRLPVAALYVDLDGFKLVNDSLGHAAGDELLQIVATRLREVVREGDTAARLGGDEFVVLVEGATLAAGPELVAERILEILRQPVELTVEAGRHFSVTASIGIATGERESADELLRDADLALYEAKAEGRNGYALFSSGMQTVAQDRLSLEMDLSEALEREQFFLLYQPTFDLQSESTTGFEALLRWRHPKRGVVSPEEFIPIAEHSGLIVPIGAWVLGEACRQAAAWHEHGHPVGMSVNVSAVQLDSDALLDEVQHALEGSGLDPAALTLEVTETTLMRDAKATAKRLHALKRLGVRIAIDDFGTGYSSLAYLRQFRADALKIDRSFISSIATSNESSALIHTLVQLGKTLNIETLAEGIEDSSQLKTLQREQCDRGQGFLYARPLDPAAAQAFLESKPAPSPAVPPEELNGIGPQSVGSLYRLAAGSPRMKANSAKK